jgi:hypothetical protein
VIEKDLRRLLRQKWDGWLDWIEPRGNAGVGRPDVDLLHNERIYPVELKIGKCIDFADRQFHVKIRPDQVAWQHRFYCAGGISFFLIASDYANIWLCRKIIMNFPRDRWVFDDCWPVHPLDFSKSIRSAIDKAK